MRKILGYFKDFHKAYFNPKLYLICFLFIAALITFNYSLDFEDTYIDSFRGKHIRIVFFALYHLFAYYGIILLIYFFGNNDLKLTKEFWIKSALGFLILGFDRSFGGYYEWIKAAVPPETLQFYYKLAYNGIRFLTILLPLLVLKLVYDRNSGEGLYGLRLKAIDLKPYWIMLLLLAPVIYIVSFSPDFIDYYPSYKRAGGAMFAQYYHISETISKIIFEVFYTSDFVYTELFFRGFLIIGFTKLLGKNAIIPMAAAYAVLHFGKPLGETIGSVFGGYILGIIALYSRNIWGGVFIHGGIALLMEIFAFWQLK